MQRCRIRLILLLLGFVLAGPRPFFALYDFSHNRIIGMIPAWPGEQFTVEWTHSVELTPWRETFALTNFGMKLVQTAFRSFGAGVPNEFDHARMQVRDGWIFVNGLDEPRSQVIYLISRDDYTLTRGDTTWRLTRFMPLNTSLQLKMEWHPWWYGMLYKLKRKEVIARDQAQPIA